MPKNIEFKTIEFFNGKTVKIGCYELNDGRKGFRLISEDIPLSMSDPHGVPVRLLTRHIYECRYWQIVVMGKCIAKQDCDIYSLFEAFGVNFNSIWEFNISDIKKQVAFIEDNAAFKPLR